MAVKVLIRRRIPEADRGDLLPLLLQLRQKAASRPGYISGETLRSHEDPELYLVIGTWRSVEEWKSWFNDPDRYAIQDKIDRLLPEKTRYEIYQWG